MNAKHMQIELIHWWRHVNGKHEQIQLLPWWRAVVIKNIEFFRRNKLASVDTWLDGTKPPKHPHLFHVADDWSDTQPFQFGVDSMQAANKITQEQLERLR